MAYNFVNASSQSISATSSPLTAYPFTACAWFITTNPTLAGDQTMVHISNSSASRGIGLGIAAATGKAQCYTFNDSGTSNVILLGSALSASTLYFVAQVGVSATNRTGYLLQGGSVASQNSAVNTVMTATSNLNGVQIGRFFNTGTFSPMSGSIAEVGIWNVALDSNEINALASAVSPLSVRPASLGYYAPLVRNLVELKGGRTRTNNNTATVTAHPRIIMPNIVPRRILHTVTSPTFLSVWAHRSAPVLGTGTY